MKENLPYVEKEKAIHIHEPHRTPDHARKKIPITYSLNTKCTKQKKKKNEY